MSGATWWVALVAAMVGAAAAIGGSVWTSRVQWRSASRAEWFRRLQWAWQLTQIGDVHSIAAGVTMMDYLADATDKRDAYVIDRIAPIARRIGQLRSEYPVPPVGVDIRLAGDDTGDARPGGEDDSDDQASASR